MWGCSRGLAGNLVFTVPAFPLFFGASRRGGRRRAWPLPLVLLSGDAKVISVALTAPLEAVTPPSWRLSLCAQSQNQLLSPLPQASKATVVSVRARWLVPARDKGGLLHCANHVICSHITQRWHNLCWLKGDVKPVTSAGDIRTC